VHIHCDKVSLEYATRSGSVSALRDVSLTVSQSEFVCLVGPSGCGKTTLLKLLAGLLEPTTGEVTVDLKPDSDRLPCALVFQDHCVFPWMTVLDNVAFGLEFKRMPRSDRHEQALEFIEQVGLGDFAKSYPNELSVGMRQRVSLARAFVARPQILLMDEPLAALDALTKHILQEDLLTTWNRHRPLIVYVTHDLTEAILMGDRIVIMSGRPGTILEEIEIPFSRPRNLQERSHPEIAEIERHLWSVLEAHVRHSMDSREIGE
jgi:NitT/TauT family transport system ATP-binding protein